MEIFVFPRYSDLYITAVLPDAGSAWQALLCLPQCSPKPRMTSASAQYSEWMCHPSPNTSPLILFHHTSSSILFSLPSRLSDCRK